MMSLATESKYESPIEELMAMSLAPLIDRGTELTPQVKVGKYRVDLMLSKSARLVAVECDGRAYHNFRDDLRRDMDLFDSGVAAVIHFRGCDIAFHRDECVSRLRSLEPQFFGDENPLPFHDTVFVCDGMAGWSCKPIYRTSADFVSDAETLRMMQACKTLHGATGLAEFRDPSWSAEYRGDTAQPLGDVFVMQKWGCTLEEFIKNPDKYSRYA